MTCMNSSNNPFAITTSPASPVSLPHQPAQSSFSDFSLPSTYESHEPPPRRDYATPPLPQSQPAPASSPQPTPKRSQTRADQEHAHLANLFAARDGDGVDTFGNVGATRYAAASPSHGYVLLMFVPPFLSVASVKLSMVSLPRKRRVLCRRTASTLLHSSSSSNNNNNIITSSHSSPSERMSLPEGLGCFSTLSLLFADPQFYTHPLPGPPSSPLTLPFTPDLASCKYYL